MIKICKSIIDTVEVWRHTPLFCLYYVILDICSFITTKSE